MIGKIEKIQLRTVWKHEAIDFTRWLQENIDVLSDEVGFELFNVEREQSTGNFNVDLLAEDSSGNTVIIENQLEKSNHDHLGKIITYLTAFEAKKAIWIVSEPRPEHTAAISWLNDSTGCDFFLLKIEAIKIGDSEPAPLLTQIVGPSSVSKEASSIKKSKSIRHQLRYQFWEGLLDTSKKRHNLFSAISPTEYNWIGAGSGTRGIQYTYWVTKDSVRIELYIDRGKDSEEENLTIFNTLFENKDAIEEKYGSSLEWVEDKENRACHILKRYHDGGWQTDEEKWIEIFNKLVDGMKNFENVFQPYIKKLNL